MKHGIPYRSHGVKGRQPVSRMPGKLHEAEKLAIILGTEGEGLAADTIADCDDTVCIPMAQRCGFPERSGSQRSGILGTMQSKRTTLTPEKLTKSTNLTEEYCLFVKIIWWRRALLFVIIEVVERKH